MGNDELRDLRARCRERVETLAAQLPLDRLTGVEELCALLSARRGRLVLPEAASLPSTIAGVWVANTRADYIFYARDAPRPHQEHIILHELAHLLCGHESGPAEVELLRALLFPHLDQTLVRSALAALGRTRYDTRQEREAELLATLIEHRWRRLRRRRSHLRPLDQEMLETSDEERDTAERLDVMATYLGTHRAL